MSKYEDHRCAFGDADELGYPVWCSACPYRDACDESAARQREEDNP